MVKGRGRLARLAGAPVFVRFGDNMRQVAVTEGDKVEAEYKFGYSVNTHGIGDLVKVHQRAKPMQPLKR